MLAVPYRYVSFDVPDSTSTSLEGINNFGHIVGNYSSASGGGAFLYDGSSFIDLPDHNGHEIVPHDINELRRIVGTSFSESPSPGRLVTHGFLLEGDELTIIDFPGAAYTGISSLNNLGDFVGGYVVGPGLGPGLGFVSDGVEFTSIEITDAFANDAAGINDVSMIVGTFHADNLLFSQGYLFESGILNVLDTPFAEALRPDDINSQGVVAGSFLFSAFNSPFRGFVMDGAEWSLIHFPGAEETRVQGINDNNQLVGTYSFADGRSHGFVAFPIPEPTTIRLLFSSVTIICFLNRTRRAHSRGI
jgi:uncharacterized membrane protein